MTAARTGNRNIGTETEMTILMDPIPLSSTHPQHTALWLRTRNRLHRRVDILHTGQAH